MLTHRYLNLELQEDSQPPSSDLLSKRTPQIPHGLLSGQQSATVVPTVDNSRETSLLCCCLALCDEKALLSVGVERMKVVQETWAPILSLALAVGSVFSPVHQSPSCNWC